VKRKVTTSYYKLLKVVALSKNWKIGDEKTNEKKIVCRPKYEHLILELDRYKIDTIPTDREVKRRKWMEGFGKSRGTIEGGCIFISTVEIIIKRTEIMDSDKNSFSLSNAFLLCMYRRFSDQITRI
jgi:hypothetical protein